MTSARARDRFPVVVPLAAASAAVLVMVGCNGILGIENAEIDPAFSGADSGVPTSDAGSQTLCESYCTSIMQACTGTHQQYLSMDVCLAMCPNFEPGREGVTDGNSLSCRISHTELAVTDPTTHCPHAGPLGLGTCGASCDGFCLLDVALCKAPHPQAYVSEPDCRTQCAAYNYIPNVGEIALDSGDSLNCRLYHLESAYTRGLEDFHCPHTGKVSETCKAP